MSFEIGSPLLQVRIEYRRASLNLDVSFELTKNWTVLFGPSGSGKTTILRSIAGTVRPDGGRIVGPKQRVLFDSSAGISVAAHTRQIRTARQSTRLFPNMTVHQNVIIGMQWYSKPMDRNDLAWEILDLFDLASLAKRMPWELSGGEAQKAILARSIGSAITCSQGMAILLLDEPFTGLDIRVREQLWARVSECLTRWSTPVLSVTHDVAEAFQLGAEVIKIAEGRVVAQGPVDDVLAAERALLLNQLGTAEERLPSSEPFLSG